MKKDPELMTTGTVMGCAAAAVGRTAGSDEPLRSFESKGGHFFLKMVFFAFWTTDDLIGPEDDGLKILFTVQTGIFKNRHFSNLLGYLSYSIRITWFDSMKRFRYFIIIIRGRPFKILRSSGPGLPARRRPAGGP